MIKYKTPRIDIDYIKVMNNIKKMKEKANILNVALCPHIKTHKSLKLGHLQIQEGAVGLSCAKTSEAKIFKSLGAPIFIANQITDIDKKKEVISWIKEGTEIYVGADNWNDIEIWNTLASNFSVKIKLRLEIDVGLKRGGVSLEEAPKLLSKVEASCSSVSIEGFFSHSGNAYACKSFEEVQKVAYQEVSIMSSLKRLGNYTISIGSTPAIAALSDEKLKGIDEIRPGNYIFYDNIAVSLGACSDGDIAIRVIGQITSVHKDRTIIDLGSKCLGLDKGAHGNNIVEGFGKILSSHSVITRLSEEHGIIDGVSEIGTVGSLVAIIPNHACFVMNQFDFFRLINTSLSGEQEEWCPIDARGSVF